MRTNNDYVTQLRADYIDIQIFQYEVTILNHHSEMSEVISEVTIDRAVLTSIETREHSQRIKNINSNML